ncbi:MAG: hypothetical protein HZB19_14655 [Chloroflexi bacterium]|nr:hypothetical protein [Chloroflexota bacterium]
MRENKTKRDPVPKNFKNVEEASDFWDTHDLSDYLDSTKEAYFDVDIQRRVYLTALEPQLARKLMEIARKQGITTETLINVWLTEKMEETVS